jgi:stage III sporulation protein AD
LVIFQVIGVALVGVVLITVLRRTNAEFATLLSVTVGVVIFAMLAGSLTKVVVTLEGIASRSGVNFLYMDTVLKVVGIAYLAEFGAQVCRDAGEGAVAAKVEMAGKVLIMVMAAPIVVAILDVLLKLLP